MISVDHVIGFVAATYGLLQALHHVWIVGVVFAAMHELEHAALFHWLAAVPGLLGKTLLLLFQVLKTGALNAAGGATEAEIDHIL